MAPVGIVSGHDQAAQVRGTANFAVALSLLQRRFGITKKLVVVAKKSGRGKVLDCLAGIGAAEGQKSGKFTNPGLCMI